MTQPDILVVMSQEAYVRFAPEMKNGGIMIVEQDMVQLSEPAQSDPGLQHPGHAYRRRMGKRMVLNSVMVGFFTAITHLLLPDAVRSAVADSVPPSFRELNLKAFEKGLEYGITALTAPPKPVDPELQMQYSPE